MPNHMNTALLQTGAAVCLPAHHALQHNHRTAACDTWKACQASADWHLSVRGTLPMNIQLLLIEPY